MAQAASKPVKPVALWQEGSKQAQAASKPVKPVALWQEGSMQAQAASKPVKTVALCQEGSMQADQVLQADIVLQITGVLAKEQIAVVIQNLYIYILVLLALQTLPVFRHLYIIWCHFALTNTYIAPK